MIGGRYLIGTQRHVSQYLPGFIPVGLNPGADPGILKRVRRPVVKFAAGILH